MKVLSILCFVGLAVASPFNQLKWEPGQRLTFDYSGRLLTGMPELANHFSGLGINCTVDIQVGPITPRGQQEFGIQIRNAKYSRVNQELDGPNESQEANNWRNLILPGFQNVPQESKQHLESPAVFKLNPNGGFASVVVDETEPEWSVNFKKALVNLLQTQSQQGPYDQDSDSINRIESFSNGGDWSRPTYWTTQEESLDGVCDVTYQVNQLPEYMIREKPQLAPYKNSCSSGSKYYEIVKTRDVSSCSKRTSFGYYKPGFFQCNTGNCDGRWTRSSITRYTACGSSNGQLNIQTIVNEGELQQNLFGFNTEKFLTGTRQNLTLVSQSQYGGSQRVQYPSNSLELDSLYYEYKLGSISSGKQGPLVDQSQLEDSVSAYKSLPRHILSTGTYKNQQERQGELDTSDLIPQMKALFKQIVNEDLFNIVDIPEKQITFKGLTIARAFSLLNKNQIVQLYHDLKNQFNSDEKKEMFQNVFADTLVMGGSVANIQVIKDMIQQGELTSVQIISVFTWLPHYVLAPTQGLLESLYELVTSDAIRNRPFIYNHAILSYSQLIQKACLAQNRQTSYPTFVFGNFCSPDSQVVMNRWIPYLQTQLQNSGTSEHRNVVIVALGLLNHKNVISALVPYVEQLSSGSSSVEYSRLTRYLAVYGLGNVGQQYPQIVTPLLVSVYSNPAESTEIRIAAFNTLLRLNPDMAVFHKIAASTWSEKDSEVLQVVNTALYSLAQQQIQSSEDVNSTSEGKAWLIYPLIKKTAGNFPTSGSVHNSQYLPKLGVGYRSVNSWISAKDSLIPSDIYGKITYFLDRYQFAPVEGALRLRGASNLAKQIMEIINPELKMESEQEGYEQVKQQLHKEWNQVIEKLQLKARKSGIAEGAVYLNLFEDSPMFHSFQSSSSEMLKEKIMPLLRNPQKLREIITGQEQRLNFQRMMNLAPSEFSIPSDMGLPMIVELHMPVTISARGHISVDASTSSSIPSVRMNMKYLFASQMTGFVGTICPFTNEYTTTGVDEHFLVNIPADISVNLNVPEQKVNIKFHAMNINQAIDLLHFHVKPYTVYQKMNDLTPMTLSSNVRAIQSRNQSQKKQVQFGESLGLELQAVLTTETAFVDFRAAMQKLSMYNYNPLNVARFGWVSTAQSETGSPSFRRHEIQIKYNPGQSSTKELEVQAQLGVATKQQGKPFKFHTVKPVDQQTHSQRKTIVPYKVVSKPLGEQSQQQTAQQKIKEMTQKQSVSEGQAAYLRVTTVFRGNGHNAATSSYSLNFLSGSQGLQQKWNVHVEDESNNQKLCVNGQLNVPQIPVWSIESLRNNQLEFSYQNEIGFGSNCQQSTIVVRGNTKSNQDQKEYSRKSQEAQQLEKLIQRGAPAGEIAQVADKVRRQASILNEVDFNVHYQNIPQQYRQYAQYVAEGVKAALWPYQSQSSQSGQGSNNSINYRIIFNPANQSFDVYVSGPNQSLKFQHLRISAPFSYLFPVPVQRKSLLDLTKSVVGKSAYPICTVTGKTIQTFDNTTSQLPLDDCYHLLSGDCSAQKSFGVLIRQKSSGNGMKQVKIFIGKTEVELIPQGSSAQNPQMKVKVNGTRTIELSGKIGQYVNIEDNQGNVVCRARLSNDKVVELYSPKVNVLSNGQKVSIEASWSQKNQLCGLCGDLNNNQLADLRGPQQCVYSKPELLSASYRVPLSSHQCSPLPQRVQQQLQAETERCAKYEVIPTKVVKSFKLNVGKCSSHQHQIIVRATDICFSQVPIMECGASCKAKSKVEKSTPFTCMPKGKLSNHYAEKARSGKILPELNSLPTTFSVKLSLPKTCEQVNRNL